MNLEQRLQHASRDLRGVPIVVPPLGVDTAARPRRRSMATPLLVPLLFVAGALLASGAARTGDDGSVRSDVPTADGAVDPATAPAPVEGGDRPEVPMVAAPSALVELQLITEFVSSARTTETPTTPATAAEPTGRLANGVGPI